MSVYPPQPRLSRREVLSRVADGQVWRYADPISHWGAPGRTGYTAIVTGHMRALLKAGLVMEGGTRGLAVYAELTDAGRALLDDPNQPEGQS